MPSSVIIEGLAEHPECIPTLRDWFEREWPAYYGAGGVGNAEVDLRTFAQSAALPIGVVAFLNGELCGVAALKPMSIASRVNLTPWPVLAWLRSHTAGMASAQNYSRRSSCLLRVSASAKSIAPRPPRRAYWNAPAGGLWRESRTREPWWPFMRKRSNQPLNRTARLRRLRAICSRPVSLVRQA
jgi:hypothetical protein